MNNYILLVSCFVLGMLLRKSGRLPDNAPSALNGFIVNVSLPALTLVTVHQLAWDARLIGATLMAWVLFGVGLVFFWTMSRVMHLKRSTTGALMLTGSMANTSFIGLPMIESWYGPELIGVGIVADQFGSYFVLSTLGLVVAGVYSSGVRFDPKAVAKKIFTFAPFVSLLLALALVSMGYQLRLSAVGGRFRKLCLGLGFKLLLGPLAILLTYAAALRLRRPSVQVTIFEAAMGLMIGAAIVAMDNDLDPSLVTLMVGIGIPLSFLTLPGWWWLLQRIA